MVQISQAISDFFAQLVIGGKTEKRTKQELVFTGPFGVFEYLMREFEIGYKQAITEIVSGIVTSLIIDAFAKIPRVET